MYLVVVDGRSERSGGMTVAELSALLGQVGADDAVNLDGGGSSTFALRAPGEPSVTVRNIPSDGSERAVANGIGVFARP
jgi:exopolysaccharide biosynthesis protein